MTRVADEHSAVSWEGPPQLARSGADRYAHGNGRFAQREHVTRTSYGQATPVDAKVNQPGLRG